MNNHFHLLQAEAFFRDYRIAMLSFITAFVVTLLIIPPLIALIKKYGIYDLPGDRKMHNSPIPTLGGIAIIAGMMVGICLWFPFENAISQVSFFFSLIVLFALGIMDDLRDLSARYKFFIQMGLAAMIALSGIRIHSFEGLFGIYELPIISQFSLTILAIVGITNAFNLIDGIDGLAAGIGFMSLSLLGIFLSLSGDTTMSLIAFELAGAILAFLFFNFNPARIFMGDAGSLVLGFVIAFLCVRLLQVNGNATHPVIQHAPVFVLSFVFIPVFDAIRLFIFRIWVGRSPFHADQNHIHHLLTRAGFSQSFVARLLCFLHGFILIEMFWLRNISMEWTLAILVAFMLFVIVIARHIDPFIRRKGWFKVKMESIANPD